MRILVDCKLGTICRLPQGVHTSGARFEQSVSDLAILQSKLIALNFYYCSGSFRALNLIAADSAVLICALQACV